MDHQAAAREVGDSIFVSTGGARTIARLARLIFMTVLNLGFRFAPPQALCYRLASRAGQNQALLNRHHIAGDCIDIDPAAPGATNLHFPGKMKFKRIWVGW